MKDSFNCPVVLTVYLLRLVLLFVFCAQISSAEAQSVDQKISRLINLGQIEATQKLLETSDPTEIDRLFFIGRILKASQQYVKAAEVFKEVLRREPQHLNAKRELAHTLLLSRQFSFAETQFRELLRTDNNEIMRFGYLRFLNVIENNKTSGVKLQFSLLPSSNINKGTNNTGFDSELGEFLIDPSMQVEPGVGVQIGVSGFFRPLITAKSRVQLGWDVSGIKYDNDTYDSLSGQLSLSYLESSPTDHWSLETFTKQTWQHSGVEMSAVGVKFDFAQRLSKVDRLAVSLAHEYRIYPVRGYQNGTFTNAVVSITHQISSKLSLSAGFQVEMSNPEAEHLQYIGSNAFGELSTVWENGTHTSLGVQFGNREFVGVYPLTGTPRSDAYTGISISVYNGRVSYLGFAPKVSCKFVTNSSNIAFFDYKSTDCRGGFTQEF